MKKLNLVIFAVVVAILASFGAGVATHAQDKAGWPETFIIGVYPGDNVEKAIQANEPLRAYLEKALGVRTVIITGTSYNAVIEAMRAGRADAFEVGPFSYILAADVAGAEAIAVGNYNTKVDLTRLAGYHSVLFTKKGSGIKSIADLKGRNFSFTDPASTSGYLVPATDIMDDQKFDDKAQLETFMNIVIAGNHPASVLAVKEGKVDAGATFDDNLTIQVKEAGVKVCGVSAELTENPFRTAMTKEAIMAIYDACPEGDIAVFHQSPLIPQTPFAIAKTLPQSFKDAVKTALLDMAKDQATVDALGRFYIDPLAINKDLKSVDAMYDPLRLIAKKLNLDLKSR